MCEGINALAGERSAKVPPARDRIGLGFFRHAGGGLASAPPSDAVHGIAFMPLHIISLLKQQFNVLLGQRLEKAGFRRNKLAD